MSLRAPIANCSDIIESPRRTATAGPPPASSATAATTRPSRTDGKGWTSRISARESLDGSIRRRRARGSSRPGSRSGAGDRRPSGHGCPAPARYRATAGIIWRPWASRPTTAIGPLPDANTRSISLSLSRAAVRRSDEDTDHAAPLCDVAHELGRPRVDLLVRLLGETRPVLLGVGGKAGRCHDRSLCWLVARVCQSATGARGSGRPGVRRLRPFGRDIGELRRERRFARPFRPLVEAVGHPGRDPARSVGRRRPVEHAPARRSAQRRGHRRRRAARSGRAFADDRLADRTRTRAPKRSQLVPLIAIGTSGTRERSAK